MNRHAVMMALAGLCLLSTASHGSIVSYTGAVKQLATPPASVGWGTFSNGSKAMIWDEKQGISVSSLPAEILNNPGNSAFPSPGNYTGLVDSHMIHHETYWYYGLTVKGTITFNNPIVAVIYDFQHLNPSDAFFAPTGTTYSHLHNFRGFTPGAGYVIVNGPTLTFELPVSAIPLADYDEIRVLTAAVPSPGPLGAIFLGSCVSLRRRRR